MKDMFELPYYSESGKIEYHHDGDAGLDLPIWDEGLTNGAYSSKGYAWLEAGDSITLRTGVHIAMPKGKFGFLDSRSGTSRKRLDLLCRIIDEPFRGNIRLSIINLSSEPVRIANGDELFQIVILDYTKVLPLGFNSYESFIEHAGTTERMADGFGSKERKKGDDGFYEPI